MCVCVCVCVCVHKHTQAATGRKANALVDDNFCDGSQASQVSHADASAPTGPAPQTALHSSGRRLVTHSGLDALPSSLEEHVASGATQTRETALTGAIPRHTREMSQERVSSGATHTRRSSSGQRERRRSREERLARRSGMMDLELETAGATSSGHTRPSPDKRVMTHVPRTMDLHAQAALTMCAEHDVQAGRASSEKGLLCCFQLAFYILHCVAP